MFFVKIYDTIEKRLDVVFFKVLQINIVIYFLKGLGAVLNTPIPDREMPEIYDKISVKNSKFVKISDSDKIDVKMQYFLLNMKNAETECYVRKEVYDMLLEAQKLLPKGIKIRVLDAWRPFALQEELYKKYSKKLIKEYNLEEKSENEKKEVICSFVSEPLRNKLLPPVHTTGGSVDVTLVDFNGNELDMGCGFDSFSERANTNYFESQNDENIKNNRRLLYNAMISAGFTNLPSEWWHYDFGDRFWAYYKNSDAIYEGVFCKGDM